jgi:putative transposase
MLKAYKYRLYPTADQEVLFARTFGCCRKVYNWALDLKNKRYSQYKDNLTRYELDKMLTFLKSTNELAFYNEVNSQALQQELLHLEGAFTKFFRKNGGYPKFKNKYDRQSYTCPQGVKIDFKTNTIIIPKVKNVKFRVDRQFTGKVKTCTVSRSLTNKYYISVLVEDGQELPVKKPVKEHTAVGIDVGLKSFLVDSHNNEVANPQFYRQAEPRLKVLQRRLSRKVLGSNNSRRAKLHLALKHEQVANQRQDFLHKLSTNLLKNHDTVFVEDLNVRGMMQNHCLAKSIGDVSWSEFFRQLQYKADWQGKNVIEIGRFQPSSKMCGCGVINKDLALKDRIWACKSCGAVNERDFLAARNILKFGLMKSVYRTEYTPMGSRGEPVESWSIGRALKQET